MTLRQQWLSLKETQPHLRIRDAAELLGTSELQLLATGCGEDCTRLEATPRTLLEALPPLGPLMALTRNAHAVHEKVGTYEGLQFVGAHMALAVGEQIDLRMFLHHWQHAFAVTVPSREGTLESIQFFDAQGHAVHKVYTTKETDPAAWAALVTRFRAADQSPEQALSGAPVGDTAAGTSAAALAEPQALLADWAALKDTHDFFSMLRRHGVTRRGALRAAEGTFTTCLSLEHGARALRGAARTGQPIMIFVHNPGCVQIHTGPVRNIVDTRGWLNVMDPVFNLHLRGSGVAEVWHVRKPTSDGDVNSIELLDVDGALLVQLFGARKPGTPEREDWRALLREIHDHPALSD